MDVYIAYGLAFAFFFFAGIALVLTILKLIFGFSWWFVFLPHLLFLVALTINITWEEVIVRKLLKHRLNKGK